MIKDKSMGRKLIFLDIDGTLLPPGDMLIPESTLAALDRARANGHKLFLCTGRNHRMTEPLLRHDCFAGAVCSAGGYVLCDGKTLVDIPMEPQQAEGVRAALENGVDSIEHGAKPDAEILRLFKDTGAFLCTTISPALPYALFDRSITHATEVEQYNGTIVFEGIIDCAKAALANDIPVVLGNDVGCPWITQYDFWRELCYFHKYCCVSNRFALYTATLRNAQLAGIGDVTGSIAPGKSADFIVTRENPLEDLRALQHLELVVCRGRAVKKPSPKRKKEVDALLDPYLV